MQFAFCFRGFRRAEDGLRGKTKGEKVFPGSFSETSGGGRRRTGRQGGAKFRRAEQDSIWRKKTDTGRQNRRCGKDGRHHAGGQERTTFSANRPSPDSLFRNISRLRDRTFRHCFRRHGNYAPPPSSQRAKSRAKYLEIRNLVFIFAFVIKSGFQPFPRLGFLFFCF